MLAASSGCRMVSHGENAGGVALYHQGNYDGAIQRFQQIVDNDPTFADGYYNLAATYHRLWENQGRKDAAVAGQAENYYRQCLGHAPDHRECYRGLAVLLVQQGRTDQAFRLVGDWSAASSAPADAKIELARLYEEFNDPQEARRRLHEAIELEPNNARALAALARLQEAGGEARQALTNYQRAYGLDESQAEVAQRIAALQSALGGGATADPATGTRLATIPDRLPRY
jgi:tetratricopeptide (TPR) repeat protein